MSDKSHTVAYFGNALSVVIQPITLMNTYINLKGLQKPAITKPYTRLLKQL